LIKTKFIGSNSLSVKKKSREIHKWLMLFMGLQFIVWSATGLYMVSMDIDYIHGDTLVNTQPNELTNKDAEQVQYTLKVLFKKFPKAHELELTKLLDHPVYRFKDIDTLTHKTIQRLVDAESGDVLSPLSKQQAGLIARNALSSNLAKANPSFKSITYIDKKPPFELSSRHLPVWRLDLTGLQSASLYVGVNNGLIVTKRHNAWRLFDWMFRFHIMDYSTGDVSNNLLLIFTVLSLLASLTGLFLIYFKLLQPILKRVGRYEND
jgi:uncharacterized iron-regulated membrane protein